MSQMEESTVPITKSWVLVALAAAVMCGRVVACAQSTQVKDLGVGKLLVAARDLSDPNFTQSVVLLVQFDKEGAVGLMINHRTQAPVSRIIQDLDTGKHGAELVYIGGPVEMSSVLGLFRSPKKPEEATAVLSEVYLLSSKSLLEKILAASSGAGDLRLYLGYCGWAPGQLEKEVKEGGWWIFEASVGSVFDPNPGSVWSRLIARTERENAETEPPPALFAVFGLRTNRRRSSFGAGLRRAQDHCPDRAQ